MFTWNRFRGTKMKLQFCPFLRSKVNSRRCWVGGGTEWAFFIHHILQSTNKHRASPSPSNLFSPSRISISSLDLDFPLSYASLSTSTLPLAAWTCSLWLLGLSVGGSLLPYHFSWPPRVPCFCSPLWDLFSWHYCSLLHGRCDYARLGKFHIQLLPLNATSLQCPRKIGPDREPLPFACPLFNLPLFKVLSSWSPSYSMNMIEFSWIFIYLFYWYILVRFDLLPIKYSMDNKVTYNQFCFGLSYENISESTILY